MSTLHMANPFAVAGTGRRPGYRWVRSPRNATIKRALLAACGTLRGQKVPPSNYYDDIERCCERSWKRHRLTRWRKSA